MTSVTTPLPQIGTRSHFTFKDPFLNYVQGLLSVSDRKFYLEAISVISLKDLVLNGFQDPLMSIYNKVGLSEEVYKLDLQDNVKIITFSYVDENQTEKLFRIPHSYIEGLTSISNVSYNNRVVLINLGMLPEDLDITGVYSDVLDLIATRIGITGTIRDISTGEPDFIDHSEHDKRESIRKNTATVKKTFYIQLQESNNALNELLRALDDEGIVLGGKRI